MISRLQFVNKVKHEIRNDSTKPIRRLYNNQVVRQLAVDIDGDESIPDFRSV
jgi:hypothetical protein